MRKWSTLVVLCIAQFLMVLDTSVMNVAISQLIEDFDAEVTQIQTAITFYSLVMADGRSSRESAPPSSCRPWPP